MVKNPNLVSLPALIVTFATFDPKILHLHAEFFLCVRTGAVWREGLCTSKRVYCDLVSGGYC